MHPNVFCRARWHDGCKGQPFSSQTRPASVVPNTHSVLVVDDSDDDILLARHSIEKAGLDVHILACSCCEEAKAAFDRLLCQTTKPAGVVLDVKLGPESGFDLLGWIRSSEEFRDLPVVMASSSLFHSDIAEASRLGADGYIEKSSRGTALIEVVRCFVEPGRELANCHGNLLCAQQPCETGCWQRCAVRPAEERDPVPRFIERAPGRRQRLC